MKARFHPLARREIADAFEHYELATLGLGAKFRERVRQITQLLCDFPRIAPKIPKGVRQISIPRFPYQLIYTVTAEEVFILAVAHKRKKPGYWQGRS